MDRRTRNILAAALATLILLAGGSAILLRDAGPDGSTPRETVTGVIVGIDSAGLDQVRGFELRTTEGEVVAFLLGPLENGATFPPGHLAEHQATAQPVTVTYRYQGPDRVALRIDDAGG